MLPTGAAIQSSVVAVPLLAQGAAATAIAAAPDFRRPWKYPFRAPGWDYTGKMLRGRWAAIAAAFAVVVAAGVTAGCGGGTGSSQALSLDPVSAAATKTQQAGPARIRFAIAFSGPQSQGSTVRLRGIGAVDGTSSEVSFRLGSMLDQMGIPSAMLPKLTHSSLKEVALEQDGDYVIYVRVGFLSSQLPGGKQWVKLDVSKLGKAAGLDVTKLFSGSQFQPTDLLSMLKGEGATIHKLGPATVGGVATTHYRVKVDVAKALQSKGLTSPLLSGLAARMKTTSEDVWIDKNGLVRRIRGSYGITKGGQSAHVSMTMDLFDYGAHLSIAAPPSSEVFDATQFAQSGLANAFLH